MASVVKSHYCSIRVQQFQQIDFSEDFQAIKCVQGANLGDHSFNTPGPVFNPGTGFGNRPTSGFVNNPQNFSNTQGFATSASLNQASSAGVLGGNMNNISPMGSVASVGANPYHSVYNVSPNSIPLGAGRPLLNGMGY